jgi:2'-5' RNA ligase
MNLTEHYNQLYKKSSIAILTEQYKLDPQINNPSDSRFGLTLLIRPSETIQANIQLFLEEIKAIEPNQYYYPDSDIHITVMGIISCYEGFTLDQINISEYIDLIEQSLVELDQIEIEFRGLTASPSAIMIQGFPTDESLNIFRNKLRESFKNSTLEQSIDSRYTIAAAHSTVMRFQEKLENTKQLIQVAEKFRDYNFGKFQVKKLELVYNDWYQREGNTIHLADFNL